MKFLLVSLILITTCACKQTAQAATDFKVGDCIIGHKYAKFSWDERFNEIYKVTSVNETNYGTRAYMFTYGDRQHSWGSGTFLNNGLMLSSFKFVNKTTYEVIQCPDGSGPVVKEKK